MAHRPMRAAFFDLDKTVIAKASIAAFGRPLYRGGLINRRLVARAVVSQLIYLHLGASEQKLARVRESMLTLTKGWDRDQIREIVREALEETVEPIIYAEALDLIEAHRAAGYKVYLVSASPEDDRPAPGRAPRGRRSHRQPGRWSTRRAGTPGRWSSTPTARSRPRPCGSWPRPRGIDLAESSAYSDSYTDLPMLEAVGHPVAVNPDRVLAKVAREREWEVMQFTKPIRLRDRVSVPSLPITATAAGSHRGGLGGGTGGLAAGPAGLALSPACGEPREHGWERVPPARPQAGRRHRAPVQPDERSAQEGRSRLAATTPRATMMARISSFFMEEMVPLPSGRR